VFETQVSQKQGGPGPGEWRRARQQAGGCAGAAGEQGEEPEVRHRGRHHHPAHRRPDQGQGGEAGRPGLRGVLDTRCSFLKSCSC